MPCAPIENDSCWLLRTSDSYPHYSIRLHTKTNEMKMESPDLSLWRAILTGINCGHSIIAANHKNHVVDNFNAKIASRCAHFAYRWPIIRCRIVAFTKWERFSNKNVICFLFGIFFLPGAQSCGSIETSNGVEVSSVRDAGQTRSSWRHFTDLRPGIAFHVIPFTLKQTFSIVFSTEINTNNPPQSRIENESNYTHRIQNTWTVESTWNGQFQIYLSREFS